MSKSKKFVLLDDASDFLQVLSSDDELSKRIAAALESRIAREFFNEEERPKQGKKSKKGGTK